ncbi:uncharacterized protein [Ptychodera flava]|uniref:uncharacterized protein n=1 Tax=Ptychodera flava TaxID=63121 RepID=UPI003969BFDC
MVPGDQLPPDTCFLNCADPGSPDDGQKLSNDSNHGDSISFACNSGLNLVGSETITCDNGTWSDEVPKCAMTAKNENLLDFTADVVSSTLGAGANGTNIWQLKVYIKTDADSTAEGVASVPQDEADQDLTAGDTLHFTITNHTVDLDGFTCTAQTELCVRIESPQMTLHGLPDDDALTGCTPIMCACNRLAEVDFPTHVKEKSSSVSYPVAVGEPVELVCDDTGSANGRTLFGGVGPVCQGDGTWSPDVSVFSCWENCLVDNSTHLIYKDGSEIKYEFNDGDYATVSCRDGFDLSGPNTVQCNNGTWDGDPLCTALTTTVSPRDETTMKSSTGTGNTSLKAATSALATSDYTERSSSIQSETSSASTKGDSTTSMEMSTSSSDASEMTSHTASSSVTSGDSTIISSIHSETSPPSTVHESTTLSEMSSGQSSAITTISTSAGSSSMTSNTATLDMTSAHYTAGSSPHTETSSSTSTEACYRWAEDDFPDHVMQKSSSVSYPVTVGETVVLTCNDTGSANGRTLFGVVGPVCQGDGTWSPDVSVFSCWANCASPDNSTNLIYTDGTEIKYEFIHGEFAVVSCRDGFTLVGTNNLQCDNGTWSAPTTTISPRDDTTMTSSTGTGSTSLKAASSPPITAHVSTTSSEMSSSPSSAITTLSRSTGSSSMTATFDMTGAHSTAGISTHSETSSTSTAGISTTSLEMSTSQISPETVSSSKEASELTSHTASPSVTTDDSTTQSETSPPSTAHESTTSSEMSSNQSSAITTLSRSAGSSSTTSHTTTLVMTSADSTEGSSPHSETSSTSTEEISPPSTVHESTTSSEMSSSQSTPTTPMSSSTGSSIMTSHTAELDITSADSTEEFSNTFGKIFNYY